MIDQLVGVGERRREGADLLFNLRVPGDHAAFQREREVGVTANRLALEAAGEHRVAGEDRLDVGFELVQQLFGEVLVLDLQADY